MNYLSLYILIGIVITLLFDLLSWVFKTTTRLNNTNRIITVFLWPLMMYNIFIMFLNNKD